MELSEPLLSYLSCLNFEKAFGILLYDGAELDKSVKCKQFLKFFPAQTKCNDFRSDAVCMF